MEKARIEVTIDLENGKIELRVRGSEELLLEIVEQMKDAEKRGEISIERMEISS